MSSDATVGAPTRQLADKNSGNFWKIAIAVLLLLVGIGFVIVIVLGFVGSVSGREFDALTWSTRSFSYMREPFTGTQLTGVAYTNDQASTSIITSHIGGGVNNPGVARWDLLAIYRSSRMAVGRAQILVDYLKATDIDRQPYWENWTTNHPQAAPVLWGAVRDCVHLPRYDRLPEIFETARTQTDPSKLKTLLSAIMVRIALEEAKAQLASGDSAAARRALKMGLFYDPLSEELKRVG